MARQNASAPPPPYDQGCSHCGAPAGYGCIRPNGSPSAQPHAARGQDSGLSRPNAAPTFTYTSRPPVTAAQIEMLKELLATGVITNAQFDAILRRSMVPVKVRQNYTGSLSLEDLDDDDDDSEDLRSNADDVPPGAFPVSPRVAAAVRASLAQARAQAARMHGSQEGPGTPRQRNRWLEFLQSDRPEVLELRARFGRDRKGFLKAAAALYAAENNR